MITVFTDGSCVRGNPGDAASAYVIMRGGSVLEGLGFPIGRGTNNEGELTAAAVGLEVCMQYLAAGEDVLLVSDSQYLLCGLPRADCYAAAGGRPNSRLWEQLYSVMLRLNSAGSALRTVWIKGHLLNRGNRLCDKLARNAAMTQTPHRPACQEQPAGRRKRRRRRRRGRGTCA